MNKIIYNEVKGYIDSVLETRWYVYFKELADRFGYGDGCLNCEDGVSKTCLGADLADALNSLYAEDYIRYTIDTSRYIDLKFGGHDKIIRFSIIDMINDTTYDDINSPAFNCMYVYKKSSV